MPAPRLIGSPQVFVYVNGQPYGKCTSFRWTSLTPHAEQQSVDVMQPLELKPTTTKVAFEMGVLRLVADGGIQASGIAPNPVRLSVARYFTVTLVERKSKLVLFSATYCQSNSESWSVTPKGLLAGTVSCTGLTWANEAIDAKPAV